MLSLGYRENCGGGRVLFELLIGWVWCEEGERREEKGRCACG